MSRYGFPMSTPNQPNQSNQPGDSPYNPGPKDPFAAGQQGYPAPGQSGQPGGYPGQQGGYQGQQGGYPGQQGGYPGQQGGYAGQQGGYPAQQGGYPAQQGGYQGQPGGYPPPPSYPGAGGTGYGAYGGALPPEPVRPQTVTFAFWCWLATAVVSIIGLVLTLTSPIWDLAVQAGTRQQGVNLQGVSVEGVVTTAKIFVAVVALVFVGVYLLFAFKMNAGRNWARIVLTVFGALTLLSAFTPTSRTVTVNSQVFNVDSGAWAGYVTAALAVAGIVLMFLAPSNKFFTEAKAYKQAKQQIHG